MHTIQLKLNDNGRGAFVIEEGNENNLTVFHTHVDDKLKGQGVASELLSTMVAYARANNKKVIALCPYVGAQFKRHPEQYADIWNQTWHS